MGFQGLDALGIRFEPIVARGKDWANGAVFLDVARVAEWFFVKEWTLWQKTKTSISPP